MDSNLSLQDDRLNILHLAIVRVTHLQFYITNILMYQYICLYINIIEKISLLIYKTMYVLTLILHLSRCVFLLPWN